MDKKETIESISTSEAPIASGPYSQGVIVGKLVFVSGQLPLDPETGKIVGGGIEDRTHRILRNIQAVLEKASIDLSRVVKTTIFLTNMEDVTKVNEVYSQYFRVPLPARSVVQVASLPRNADIEMEAIAAFP